MPSPSMKFSEFVDLLLVKLYELDRAQPDTYFNLDNVAQDIRGDIPTSWVFDAAKVLETRALADVLFTFGGTDAKISGEGRLYVEEGRGITQQAIQQPNQYFIHVTGSQNQVVTGSHSGAVTQTTTIEAERAPAFKILAEIKERLNRDASLSPEVKAEATSYATLIENEIKKREPNRNLIGAVLEPLSKIASIAGSVASLIKLFNAAM